MAKTDRLFFRKASGQIGKQFVFKQYNDQTIIAKYPDMSKRVYHSLGASRQYCGTTGKVDHCQVAVYAASSAENYYGLIKSMPGSGSRKWQSPGYAKRVTAI